MPTVIVKHDVVQGWFKGKRLQAKQGDIIDLPEGVMREFPGWFEEVKQVTESPENKMISAKTVKSSRKAATKRDE